MNRLDFIKINLLASLGINSLFHKNNKHSNPSTAHLTGKENPFLENDKYLHPRAYEDFKKMHRCALKEGINIKIVSGYRSFERQLSIWNYKYNKYKISMSNGDDIVNKISEYSAIPGTSRHHWGTEIDIIEDTSHNLKSNLLNQKHFEKNGSFYKMHLWLKENAHQFGYYMVYTDAKCRSGFHYEPWHFSYRPVSLGYLEEYFKLDLASVIKHSKMNGKEYITETCLKSYFQTHLKGINPKLLP